MEWVAKAVADILSPIDKYRKAQGAQYAWHQKVFPKWSGSEKAQQFDGFYLEVYSEQKASFTLELVMGSVTALRHALKLEPGWNRVFIDCEQWPRLKGEGLLRLSSNMDMEVALLISALHLVRWRDRSQAVQDLADHPKHLDHMEPEEVKNQALSKIKCVVFDLDNTLWKGVIGDDGADGVVVRQEALDFIHALDQRGIICAVASKNEAGIALEKIEAIGLSEFLLFPEINWGPKSQSIRRIAEAMNVSLDTFAFVDDNAFERREVQAGLPMVRVYPEHGLDQLLRLADFDVPVTEQAAKRRLSYLAESRRVRTRSSQGDGADAFLRSCNMKLSILSPAMHVDRCLEMIDRTNQFNISGQRYSKAEFERLLKSDLHWAWSVRDDYGDYGIVGYLRAEKEPGAWVIKDFVMSCRVAQKRIEEGLFSHFRAELSDGLPVVLELIKTSRNDAIIGKLTEMGNATPVQEGCFRVQLNDHLDGSDVVTIEQQGHG
ncbi:HAD-IIIC family phosphatase [Flavobacteriales bacterium]|nr:HAD-IIIC family phosphatase [Flavobacteriales bacterium]